MKHILLGKALRYRKRKKMEEPKGFYFDHLAGAWVDAVDGSFLISSENFKGLATKKDDIESGEDQKEM